MEMERGQEPIRGEWRGSGSSGFLGLSRLFGSTNERDKTKKRGRESFLIAWSETCLITLLRTDLILMPHPSRLTFLVLSISRRVAGSWFIWSVGFLWFVWFRERNNQDKPDRPNKPATLPLNRPPFTQRSPIAAEW